MQSSSTLQRTPAGKFAYLSFLACVLLSPPRAQAQHAPDQQPFVRDFLRDEIQMWSSPFRRSSYSTRTFSKYVVPFALLTGALIATDHQTADLLPNTKDQSKWSLRVSQIGAPYTLAGMAGGVYLIGRATKDKKARETGFLAAEAIAHSQLLTVGMKYITQRERPLDFKAKGGGGTAFWKSGDSFPSGHSSGSFALATVFAYEYGPDHRWVPYASYGLASVVAASRLSGQKHWVSDISVGSTMGFLVGRYVYKHHHAGGDHLVPQVGFGAGQVSLSWQLDQQQSPR